MSVSDQHVPVPDIGHGQFLILLLTCVEGEIKLAQLAKEFRTHPDLLSHTIRRLCDRGLMTKTRRAHYSVTAAGRKAIDGVDAFYRHYLEFEGTDML